MCVNVCVNIIFKRVMILICDFTSVPCVYEQPCQTHRIVVFVPLVSPLLPCSIKLFLAIVFTALGLHSVMAPAFWLSAALMRNEKEPWLVESRCVFLSAWRIQYHSSSIHKQDRKVFSSWPPRKKKRMRVVPFGKIGGALVFLFSPLSALSTKQMGE